MVGTIRSPLFIKIKNFVVLPVEQFPVFTLTLFIWGEVLDQFHDISDFLCCVLYQNCDVDTGVLLWIAILNSGYLDWMWSDVCLSNIIPLYHSCYDEEHSLKYCPLLWRI